MKKYIFLAAFALLTCGSASSQWVPVQGKIRETREVFLNGQKVETHVREGLFYRSSNGSTLTHWTQTDGDTQRSTGTLADNSTMVNYQLDFTNRIAIERRSVLPPGVNGPLLPTAAPASEKAPEIFLGGVRCRTMPANFRTKADADAGKPFVRAGEVCWSNEYSLLVREDLRLRRSGEREERFVFEVFDIEPNVEPDPKLFDLRARGFTVYGAKP